MSDRSGVILPPLAGAESSKSRADRRGSASQTRPRPPSRDPTLPAHKSLEDYAVAGSSIRASLSSFDPVEPKERRIRSAKARVVPESPRVLPPLSGRPSTPLAELPPQLARPLSRTRSQSSSETSVSAAPSARPDAKLEHKQAGKPASSAGGSVRRRLEQQIAASKPQPQPQSQPEERKNDEVGQESDHESDYEYESVKIVDEQEVAALEAKLSVSPSEAQEDDSPSTFKFAKRTTFSTDVAGHASTETFCLAFSPDSKYVASGCGDGSVRIFTPEGRLAHFLQVPTEESLPVTCIRYRPEEASSTIKGVLLVANADGSASHWHPSTNKCLWSLKEDDNQIYSVDFNPDGSRFATAGRDAKIRIYDETSHALVSTLAAGQLRASTGHSNRVYAVKFKHDQPDIVISGGWDNTVQIWDLRVGHSVNSIYGPHICGDALDVDASGNTMVTASWRPDKSLELWDFRKLALAAQIQWQKPGPDRRPEMLYSAQFSPDASMLAAGGTGTNEAKLFTRPNNLPIDRVSLGAKGCYSVTFAPSGKKMAVGGGDPQVTLLDL